MIIGMQDELPFKSGSRFHGMTINEILWDDDGKSYLRWVLENKSVTFSEEVESQL